MGTKSQRDESRRNNQASYRFDPVAFCERLLAFRKCELMVFQLVHRTTCPRAHTYAWLGEGRDERSAKQVQISDPNLLC